LNGLLEHLTDPQRDAVTHIDGPLLILAGPGSGKTRVITHRIAWLLAHGIPAWQIVALTFTNKAADEMKRRLAVLAPGEKVWVSTFHRFCARLLRQYARYLGLEENYSIYDTGDSLAALKRVIESLNLELTHITPERVQGAISWAKNNLITAEDYQPKPGNPIGNVVAQVYPRYQAELLASSAVDFDDMLLHVATLLRDHPEVRAQLDQRYRYVMVDEYQDTNLAQYAIVRAMSIDHPNLAVTGDPDQSIYGWRGANLNNILEFEKDFPDVKIVRLEQNYRSTKRILRVADHLIQHNTKRKKKSLFTENDEGKPVALLAQPNEKTEADWIANYIAGQVAAGRRQPRDFAVFYRMNALSRQLEHSLREYGVPYQMVNGVEFYQRKEIKDVLAYLHLLNNPRDGVAFLRIINTPPRGIGRATIGQLLAHADRRGLPLLDAAREAGLIETLSKRAAVSVAKFVGLYDRLAVASDGPVEEIMGLVLSESGYRQMLIDNDSEEDYERLANIEELLTAAREYDEQNPGENRLEGFLEQASLVNDTDAWEVDDNRATLMTLHAAKGLEFPVVFIVAIEEGLLPHERSRAEADQIEEERRLLFVGITRAQQELHLSMARYRSFRGQSRMAIPSPFLMQLPTEEMEVGDYSWATPGGPSRSVLPEAGAWSSDDVVRRSPDNVVRGSPDPAHHSTAGLPDFLDADETFGQANDTVGRPYHNEDGRTWHNEARSNGQLRLTTAAALSAASLTAGECNLRAPDTRDQIPDIHPDSFHHGMLVRHPEYGLGKILALSGTGVKRTATVAFAQGAGEKRFILVHSKLQPAKMGPNRSAQVEP
jgi:DNA helicase-2/ATP-dependent DNA helicase PcrA